MLNTKPKRQILFLSLMLLLLVGLTTFNVKAVSFKTYDDTQQHYFQTNETVSNKLYGVEHKKIDGETYTGKQSVNLFQMKTDGVNSKLVTWYIQDSNTTYKRNTLPNIAKDYEKNHPGWKVVAGVNGDQYTATYGTYLHSGGADYFYPQPYYPAIIDGERRFAYSVAGHSSMATAFTNDGSRNGFVDVNNVAGLYVEVLDATGNVVSKYPVESINNSASANNTSVWFSYVGEGEKYVPLDIKGENLYYVSNAELAYMSNNHLYHDYKQGNNSKGEAWGVGIDHVFGRGTIDQVTTSVTGLTEGAFVIESTDPKLTAVLGTNVRVRVQFYYSNDALNKAEAATGYHSVQRLNGKDIPVDPANSYNTGTKDRSVFGITADGTYVLLTADKDVRGTGTYIKGLTGWELNALLKANNVITAYQQDGGGSVTAIWRNESGGFDIVNTPSDASTRHILAGVFFVVKESGLEVSSIDAKPNEITFNIDTSKIDMSDISNIYCYLDGQRKEVIDNTVTFNKLNKMTEYDYRFTFKTKSGKEIDAVVDGAVKTSKEKIDMDDLDIDIDLENNKVTFTPNFKDIDDTLEYIRIVIGDQRIPYLDEPIVIDITADQKTLEVIYTYCYDLEDGKGKIIVEEPLTLQLREDEPDIIEKPSDDEKGCKKDATLLVISLISLSSLLLIFRKRQ